MTRQQSNHLITCVTLSSFQDLLQKNKIITLKDILAIDAENKPVPSVVGVQHNMFNFRKSLNLFIGILMLLCYSNLPALAQDGGTAGSFSRIGFGPRGMAMGNTLVSVTREGIYSYYNPALAAHAVEGNQIDFSTASMSFDRSFNTVNGTFRLPPTAGITLSLMNAAVSNIDGRSVDGYNTGTLNTHEYQAATALGVQITKKLSAGLGLKYFIADYHTDLSNAKTVGLDLGLLYKLSDQFRGGVTVQDLLASYSWNSAPLYDDESSARTDNFPRQFRIGASHNVTSTLLLSLEGGQSIYENSSRTYLRIGSSCHLHERITIRAGWQVEELSSPKRSNHGSAGFSIHLPFDLLSPSVDYAFIQEENNISYMHTFGLRLNL
jgi:hypothetical protein